MSFGWWVFLSFTLWLDWPDFFKNSPLSVPCVFLSHQILTPFAHRFRIRSQSWFSWNKPIVFPKTITRGFLDKNLRDFLSTAQCYSYWTSYPCRPETVLLIVRSQKSVWNCRGTDAAVGVLITYNRCHIWRLQRATQLLFEFLLEYFHCRQPDLFRQTKLLLKIENNAQYPD